MSTQPFILGFTVKNKKKKKREEEYGFIALGTLALNGFLREDFRRRVEHSDEHTEDGEDATDDGARALRVASRQRALRRFVRAQHDA